jgi:hypothetical protein
LQPEEYIEHYKDGDVGFTKVWWSRMRKAVKGPAVFNGVAMLILGKGQRGNPVDMTLAEIAEEEGVGIAATSRAVSELLRRDVIRRKGAGVFYVNPSIVFRGRQGTRAGAMGYYLSLPAYQERKNRETRNAQLPATRA